MATTNPLILPRQFSDGPNCIPALPKSYSGGTNTFGASVTKFLDGSAAAAIHGARILPTTFDNTQTVTAVAVISLPTAGDAGEKVRLNFAYTSQDDGESSDPAATQTVSVSHDISALSAETYDFVEFTLTGSNFSGEDLLEYSLERDPTHADDNYADAVLLHHLYLRCNY